MFSPHLLHKVRVQINKCVTRKYFGKPRKKYIKKNPSTKCYFLVLPWPCSVQRTTGPTRYNNHISVKGNSIPRVCRPPFFIRGQRSIPPGAYSIRRAAASSLPLSLSLSHRLSYLNFCSASSFSVNYALLRQIAYALHNARRLTEPM